MTEAMQTGSILEDSDCELNDLVRGGGAFIGVDLADELLVSEDTWRFNDRAARSWAAGEAQRRRSGR